MNEYIGIAVILVLAAGLTATMVALGSTLGKKNSTRVKLEPFECGKEPFSLPIGKLSIKFYLTAILFILFDVEVVFLFPWAASFGLPSNKVNIISHPHGGSFGGKGGTRGCDISCLLSRKAGGRPVKWIEDRGEYLLSGGSQAWDRHYEVSLAVGSDGIVTGLKVGLVDDLGATGEAYGEVVFNTAMSGYQEILTDPSYFGQIVTMTYPRCAQITIDSNRVIRSRTINPRNIGSTADTTHALLGVASRLANRRTAYVAMTRGRHANTAGT